MSPTEIEQELASAQQIHLNKLLHHRFYIQFSKGKCEIVHNEFRPQYSLQTETLNEYPEQHSDKHDVFQSIMI
jgi:hypothetical protein